MLFEAIEWNRNPAKFNEWEFGDVGKGILHDWLCGILEERANVIFGEEGLQLEIMAEFEDDGTPSLTFGVQGGELDDPIAKGKFSLEKILGDIVEEAAGWSDETPGALKAVLEKALADLNKKIEAP